MKRLKFNLATFLSLIIVGSVYSQNEMDALRYSRLTNGGTARYLSMGGAFSALGYDFSSISSNPAGLGLYKSSEIMFTPSIVYNKTKSSYLNTSKQDFKYNFNFSNFGFVASTDLETDANKAEWKNIQFGFGLNKHQHFSNRTIIEGFNQTSTILNVFRENSQGLTPDKLNPFDAQLAFNTYLTDTINGNTNYFQAHYGGALQRKSILTSGGINELVFSLSGNYNDKLYVGGMIGVPVLRYKEISSYKEVDVDNSLPEFNSLTYSNELNTYGTGFNFKVGIIYKIQDWLRFAGAFHTPTFYTMSDNYSTKMQSNLDTHGKLESKSPKGNFDYYLVTPMKALGGLAFVFPKIGILSVDYELADYRESRLREKNIDANFDIENEAISNNYQITNNIRIGTEINVLPVALRFGYALYSSPFNNVSASIGSENIFSTGIGIREENYYIDLAFIHSNKKEEYYLYPGLKTPANLTFLKNQFVITLGFKL